MNEVDRHNEAEALSLVTGFSRQEIADLGGIRTPEACSYCRAEATDYFELPREAIAAGTLDADDRIFPVCPRHLVICRAEYAAFVESCCSCSFPGVSHIIDGAYQKPVCFTHLHLFRKRGYREVVR